MPSSNVSEKLRVLAAGARYDASCASSGSNRKGIKGGIGSAQSSGICHSWTPDGRCVSLLKILLTNYCIYDCLYCINRKSNDIKRARFTPEEVASLCMSFYQRNYIEGLFLSSGVIKNPDYTMEELTRAVKLLRSEHRFGGYIHLKAIPGASPELISQAGRWVDRISANIELPTEDDITSLAPKKNHREIEAAMNCIKQNVSESKENRRKSKKAPTFAPSGQSTQMIVGATPSSDNVLLKKAAFLYDSKKLKRVYYSAFSPIAHSDSLLPKTGAPLVREHRLYQADWLRRYYCFDFEELTSEKEPNLDLKIDPKLAWALKHREFFPVDINVAPRESLLRVPGLGYRSVQRILSARRYRAVRFEDLKRLRVSLKRAKYFILTAERDSAINHLDESDLISRFLGAPKQLSLFTSNLEALNGEL